ncbi:MAG: glycerophosphodiester phosphodiesterase family protein [Cycloclasticus sp.]
MLSFGHRGAMGYVPENTLLSVQKAIELGADWVEIDVYLVNRQLMVIHDDTLDRTTNGKGSLFDYTFEKLREFDAGEGERIPILLEIIQATKDKVGLNIELKGEHSAKAVHEVLSDLSDEHKKQVLISSFKMSELQSMSTLDESINIGVLAGGNMSEAFAWAQKLKASSIHFSKRKVTQALVNQAHSTGLKLYVYTVNERAELRRMKMLGVDGVFSNYPDRALSV